VRRIAEDLRWPSNYFDIVIASFGIICFSNTHRTLPNIYSVLKPDGLVTISGYNRNAIKFEFDALMQAEGGSQASHFAINIDREKNVMKLNEVLEIRCFTFYPDDMAGILSLVGFKHVESAAETFPQGGRLARLL
jgi:SAM-dependent methyltransferase